MTLMFKLIWRDLRANPGRMAVSVFAILVSVSLIVWMMGSYDTLVREFDNDAEAYMGNYDLCLVPELPKGPFLPDSTRSSVTRSCPPVWPPLPLWKR